MNKDDLERTVGKDLLNSKTFASLLTFGAYRDAEKFCKQQNFSVGRMCSPQPTGIKRGDWDIQKWNNLAQEDKKLMDGALMGNFRHGPVTVHYTNED